MKYDTRKRTGLYLFTVTNSTVGEALFKAIRKVNREVLYGKGGLVRYFRLRDRKSVGVSRANGYVSKEVGDRWDLYLKRPWTNRLGGNLGDGIKLIRALKPILREGYPFQEAIEYVNVLYKDVFEGVESIVPPLSAIKEAARRAADKEVRKVFLPPEYFQRQKPVRVTEVKNPMNKKATFNVTATMRITIDDPAGSCPRTTLVGEILGGGRLQEVRVTSYDLVDEHRDLPLVDFQYLTPDESAPGTLRRVRVVKMDEEYLSGYEDVQFKKFRVDRIVSAISLIELPEKK